MSHEEAVHEAWMTNNFNKIDPLQKFGVYYSSEVFAVSALDAKNSAGGQEELEKCGTKGNVDILLNSPETIIRGEVASAAIPSQIIRPRNAKNLSLALKEIDALPYGTNIVPIYLKILKAIRHLFVSIQFYHTNGLYHLHVHEDNIIFDGPVVNVELMRFTNFDNSKTIDKIRKEVSRAHAIRVDLENDGSLFQYDNSRAYHRGQLIKLPNGSYCVLENVNPPVWTTLNDGKSVLLAKIKEIRKAYHPISLNPLSRYSIIGNFCGLPYDVNYGNLDFIPNINATFASLNTDAELGENNFEVVTKNVSAALLNLKIHFDENPNIAIFKATDYYSLGVVLYHVTHALFNSPKFNVYESEEFRDRPEAGGLPPIEIQDIYKFVEDLLIFAIPESRMLSRFDSCIDELEKLRSLSGRSSPAL